MSEEKLRQEAVRRRLAGESRTEIATALGRNREATVRGGESPANFIIDITGYYR